MKKTILFLLILLVSVNARAFEIFALGTSNTNCKNVDRSRSFTATLEASLREKGIDVNVINSGVDGDKPIWMMPRLEQALANPNVKIVIVEPGPNDRNPTSNVKYTEELLSKLRDSKMISVYVSHGIIQSKEEALATAQKYRSYYYGHWRDNVPGDRTHHQFDTFGVGHMTAEGCMLWAKNMVPLILQIIKENNIK